MHLLALMLLSAVPPPMDGLQFLVGEWTAEAPAAHQAAPGKSSIRAELGGTVLLRRDHVEALTADGKPAPMDMLMTLYAEAGTVKADYVDGEGHVIHYTVQKLVAGQSLELVSAFVPGPSFRLTYTLLDAHRMNVRFEMAPPGRAQVFKTYTEGVMRRP